MSLATADELTRLRAAVNLANVFRARGFDLDKRGWGRCPFHDENSGSFHAYSKSGVWRYKCFGCGKGGDVFAALQELDGLTFPEARAEALRLSGCLSLEDLPAAPAEVTKTTKRAPRSEVSRLWERSTSALRNGTARLWLQYRGFDPARVAELDLCRVLPKDGLPIWAGYGDRWRSWTQRGYPIAFRTYDSDGHLAGLRARPPERRDPKALGPFRVSSHGTVLANREGALLLRGNAFPRLVICEGETDLMAASLAWPGVPVLGVGNGWWTAEHAARVPDGCQVLLATDWNEAGIRYAREVADSLEGRCRLTRLGRSSLDLAERYQANDLPGDPWGGAR